TLAFLTSLSFSASAQNEVLCGSTAARQRLIAEHPEVLQDEAELEEFTKNFQANYANFNVNRDGNIVIPIVFHILHQGNSDTVSGELISDEQIRDQMHILNEDYNKRNADTASVISVFKPLIANIGIEFRLANIDPNGQPTNGIDRINTTQTYMGNDYSKLNSWPRDKYLNVWVCKSMRDGVAGYAYYPGSVQALYNTPAMDGIIILSQYIGAAGTGSYGLARALTHEIGHYLNLKHPWGDTNEPGVSCGDDDVDDTPITRGSTTCNLNLAYCTPPIKENVQNFMDYSYCSRMFTEGQKTRMLAALNSDKADRNNLWSAANLIATGTDDTTYVPGIPKADIGALRRYVCLGANVQLSDASYNGDVTDYYWEMPNANPPTSNEKNPIVQFLTLGWQPIKLTVTGPGGVSVKERNNFVYVGNDNASYIAPFTQDFETSDALTNGDWTSINYDLNNTEITRSNYGSHTGSGAAVLNNYYAQADRDIDEIVSPGFDMTALTTNQMSLSFYYSWATSTNSFGSNPPDSIEVQASLNCGSTWVTIYKKGALGVLNAGAVTGYFVPTQASAYWKYIKINLAAGTWRKPNVRFKFKVYGSTRGNNFYIDDINIGSYLTGIEDVSVVNEVNIFPNPTEGAATISLSLAAAGKLTVNITDLTGKEVARVFDGFMNDGDTQLPLEGTEQLASGVYIVNVKAGESVVQKKLVIN
ncbi:MAG TPA: M43 family zinc metalloprotease, partial [Chitinophagales bacterium]|nr:M43 family zinc metalloprotease [Chitinophagales bacterium]